MTLFQKEIALRFSDVNVITTLLIETYMKMHLCLRVTQNLFVQISPKLQFRKCLWLNHHQKNP